jgi:phenylacetate-CoA ligase
VYSLEELVGFSRQNSPFFANLYKDVPLKGYTLNDLPLIDISDYWKMERGISEWSVLTGPVGSSIVFRSGGTTGASKLSIFTREEWSAFQQTFASSVSSIVDPNDRIANLFFCGDLYASLLFIHGTLGFVEKPVCEFPFTGQTAYSDLSEGIVNYQINVISALPATLLKFSEWLLERRVSLPQITKLLYGGESLLKPQLDFIMRTFPNARCYSIGCASVDAGLIGASTPDCNADEHRCFDGATLLEILDEQDGTVINELGKPGLLVVTNLQRKLMPIIRYPVGDRAAWVEDNGQSNRKFLLMGRSSLGKRIRIGYVSLYPDDIDVFIADTLGACSWQLVIEYTNPVNIVNIRIAQSEDKDAATKILEFTRLNNPPLIKLEASGQAELRCTFCNHADLALNSRTGKLLRVVDNRPYQINSMT